MGDIYILSQVVDDPGMNTGDPTGDDDFVRAMHAAVGAEAARINAAAWTLDIYFLTYLKMFARFGYFTFGPINIDVGLIEDIVERTTPRRTANQTGPILQDENFDFVLFSRLLVNEVKRSGRRRVDELHFLLAFMRTGQGIPKRVFGELGVSPESVEEFARTGSLPNRMETLFSPEQAAEYLNVHVRTVRAWIRSGRLRARRLAGQRALRITSTDLQSVLEPVSRDEI
jgi:excisionase family DNA binding protein